MSETRTPEQMPTEGWRIKSFAHEKGFGALLHESGDEVTFNFDVWNLGTWKPSHKEAAITGPASPLLPREGEPVRVRWKLSLTGRIVPALVEPTGRVSSKRKEYKLNAWLKGMQRAGVLGGLTASELLKALAKLDEGRAEEWRDGEPREAGDYAFLLMDLGNLHEVDPKWAAEHVAWIYADDHRWDGDRAVATLPSLLGLGAAPAPEDSDNQSLSEYVRACNAAAEREGAPMRLHEVAIEADAHVFVRMPAEAFSALVKDGYLDRSE